MKRLPLMVGWAGVFLAAACAQPLGKGVISGAVVDNETGDAIRKAVVTLTLEGTPRRWATARTDGSGRFQFEGLPGGKYDLRAAKQSEGTAVYGANSVRELGDLIALGEAEIRTGIVLRFLQAASISGHVYDSDGEPVAEAVVSLLRNGRNLGTATLLNYRGAGTDDQGEYRISNVDPSQYYLRATPADTRGGIGGGGFGGGRVGVQGMLVEQYYGGARDSKDASAVRVRGGQNLNGFDFHLIAEPAVQVRGHIVGVPAGIESPEPQVTISPASARQQGWSMGVGVEGPENRFQFGDLPSGRYWVEAVLPVGNKTYAASQVFDLRADSGEILLTLAPAGEIQGSLRVEGKADGDGFRVQLTKPGERRGNLSAQVGADGRFTLGPVTPGDWQLSVTPMQGFLKSAQFGDKDVRFTTFEVGSRAAPLNIVVSMHTATVAGEIDAGSTDSKRAGIVIAPVGQYHNFIRFYYGAAADDEGKFHRDGIAPGKYKIFALEKMAAGNFRNPEAVDQLDELGEVIDLPEGATVQVHPKLIPMDRAVKALQ